MTLIKKLHTDERGSISVMLSLLFPMIVLLSIYQNGNWQANYIQVQTQIVLDLATLGGAETGTVTKVQNNMPSCSIPYNSANTEDSGYHVSYELLQYNARNTLPQEVIAQIVKPNIAGLQNWEEQASGYISIHTNFKYKAPLQLFFNRYVFNVSSTSRCQPE